jgi:hypothetical protein
VDAVVDAGVDADACCFSTASVVAVARQCLVQINGEESKSQEKYADLRDRAPQSSAISKPTRCASLGLVCTPSGTSA